MAVYALLAAGESPTDPKLKPAITWLLKADLVGVYALTFRCLALSMLPPDPAVRQVLKHDGEVLMRSMLTNGPPISPADTTSA